MKTNPPQQSWVLEKTAVSRSAAAMLMPPIQEPNIP